MMKPDVLFRIVNSVAMLSWFVLILFGRIRKMAWVVGTFVAPAILSVVYVVIFAGHWRGHQGGFGSLSDVQLLFSNRWLLLMGWVHYLAFDLFVGSWQVQEAKRIGRSHLWVVPTLILTFLFGPLGLLVFLLLRAALSMSKLEPTFTKT